MTKLKEVGVTDMITPLGESNKKGLWRVSNLLFRFNSFWWMWNISAVVSGHMEEAYDQVVLPYLNDCMGKVFEEIAKQYIEKYADLPFPLGEVSTWWGGSSHLKKEIEIDIVARSAISNETIIGSAKYRERKMPLSELDLMRTYASEMGGNGRCQYWFFSKSGFEDEFITEARNSGDIRLYTLGDLYDI